MPIINTTTADMSIEVSPVASTLCAANGAAESAAASCAVRWKR